MVPKIRRRSQSGASKKGLDAALPKAARLLVLTTMCGLCGYLGDRPTGDDKQVLARMTATLYRRGPDAQGEHHGSPIHLGHRRLSVIDPAGSAQPLFSAHRQQVLVFNGEIYNYRALRDELRERGHKFQTEGDGEVILAGYREWGEAVVRRLQGMFAFALWDAPRGRLLLVRDHLGVKPLYVYHRGGLVAFASELKALLEHPDVDRTIDLDAIGLFLRCQYIPGPRSIYTHIKKLPPAHYLVIEKGAARMEPYWSPNFQDKLDVSLDEAADQLEKQLRASVESMLVADVPLGAFLSGGIDSSLVAAIMADLRGGNLQTFNLGFANTTSASEHVHAQTVADHIGAEHHCLMIEHHEALARFDDLAEIFDEPFADNAALPTLALSGLARQHVTVALTGEGADEIFSGYSNYRKRIEEEKITRWLGAPWSPGRYVGSLLPPRLRKDRIVSAAARTLPRRYVTIPNVFHEAEHGGLFSRAFRRRTSARLDALAEQAYHECNSADYHDRIMWVDSRLWLPDDLLVKVDRATMAYSLEARVPYLDHKFVEFATRLPSAHKQQGHTTKLVLRKVAERYLPREILERGKQGFVIPVQEWMRHNLHDHLVEHLGEGGLLKRNLLQPAAVNHLVQDHISGKRNHGFRLWTLLMLEKWFRRWAPEFEL